MGDVIAALRSAFGDDALLTGDDVHSRASGIWRSEGIRAKALVRPRDTAGVSRALAICHAHGQSVIPHGGLTGLVGSALTSPDDVVVSLERMNRIEEINTIDRTMTVQAGAVLQTIQEQADAAGLLFPLDLGGRGSATIGGNISTNAGGNRVIRYGMTRDMVLGLEAVLADGTVVSSMNRMIKNNAGYDLKQLFIGSEGSLGIVTRAVLRLARKAAQSGDAVRRGRRIRQAGPIPEDDGRRARRHAVGVRSDVEQLLSSGDHGPGDQPAAVAARLSLLRARRSDGRRSRQDHERIEAALADAYEEGLDRGCGDRPIRSTAPAVLGDARRCGPDHAATDRRSSSTSACAFPRWKPTSMK